MNKITRNLICASIFLILSTFTITVNAAIYKCVDASGETFYKDKPCEVGVVNKETEFKAIKPPKLQPEVGSEDDNKLKIYEG